MQVTVAALTVGRGAAVVLGVFTAASYGVLIDWHVHELVPTHHRLNDFPTHLSTMWLAGTVVAELVAYFVGRASIALQQREDALEQMRARAARSERLVSLTTLAAGAAHELSTPLGTIAVAARELEHALVLGHADADLTDDARLIRGEVDRCQAILDQMSGRAGGSMADEPESVPVADLFDEVRMALTSDRANRLVVHSALGPPSLVVPRAALRQTLLSLIGNAFDASTDTPVVVDVTEAGDGVRVTVADSGPGLTPEAAARAGEPFYTTKEPGRGLGLGLFLARVFAERLGGTLKLESGNGTTAILELPHRTSSAEGMSETGRESRTLLIVDDDQPFRLRLLRAFRDRGFDATGAGTYDEAIAVAQADSPEFALVDLRLPGLSGLEVVRTLKALDTTTNVVVLTGYGSIAPAVESVKLGATTYLTKPVDADQILAAFDGASETGATPTAQPLARVEWEHIQRVLADCDGNLSQAARVLRIHRRSLQRKLCKNPVPERGR